MGEFTGKTIFITGAGKGQGRAVALAFAKEGANIAAFDLGAKIDYPAYNNSSLDDLEKLSRDVKALGANIVTCAGICAYGLAHELSEAEWDAMIDINLKGAWLAAKYTIPHMIKQKSGVIINNSSIAGLRGMNRLSHYAASKWGLIGLVKSWAIELAPYGIRALSIHPTAVNTPMNDGLAFLEGSTPREIAERSAGNLLPVPWVEPEDVADSVLFLASDKARYFTGGQYVLDAGLLTR